jgi:hypothetical protein
MPADSFEPLTGGCLCGGVRYAITEPLGVANYCHCTRCQRRTGTAAAASARVPLGAFDVVQGDELIRSYDPPGGGFTKAFCGTCGSALFSRNPETGQIGVRLGTIDGDPGVRPSRRTHVQTAAVWEPIPEDGLPRYPQGAPD